MTASEIVIVFASIAVILLFIGLMLAYPIRWFHRSDIDDETLIKISILLIGASIGINGCSVYIFLS